MYEIRERICSRVGIDVLKTIPTDWMYVCNYSGQTQNFNLGNFSHPKDSLERINE